MKKIMGLCFTEKSLLLIAAIVRVLFIAFGEWQDACMEVRYTDIDYQVFSDAAALVTKGQSPFERETYRYSPLLALILVPNTLLHPAWGKFLFSAAGHVVEAAVWYGVVVHFRIYPIIYVMAMLVALDSRYSRKATAGKALDVDSVKPKIDDTSTVKKGQLNCFQLLVDLLNRNRILFGFVSGGVFFLLTGFCYWLYGDQFLHEALLYHLTRTDPRHNFSIYFYHIYLHHGYSFTLVERLLSFVPQFLVQSLLTAYYAKDVAFCFFIQTVAFVAFNKVITAQYFVWFFCLFPLILPWTTLMLRWKGTLCMLLWTAAQLHWLMWAYALEFQGKNVFLQLWLASITFFGANIFVLSIIIRHHTFAPSIRSCTIFEDSVPKKENKWS